MRRFVTPLVVALTLAACSKLSPSAKDKSAPDDEPDDEATEATAPAEVAGAFLTRCAQDAYAPEADQDLRELCVLETPAGARVDSELTAVTATVVTADGQSLQTTAKVIPGSLWHFGFALPVAQAKIKQVDFHYAYGAQTPNLAADSSVTDLVYDWAHDPLFATVLAAFGAKAQPLAAVPADAQHLVFITDAVYKGDFGKDGIDKPCQDAGARVDAARTWMTLVSTTALSSRAKVKVHGSIYSVMGDRIAKASDKPEAAGADWNAAGLFDSDLGAVIRYTETGRSANAIDLNLTPPRLLLRLWTGNDPHGNLSPDHGTCADWTSAASDATGAIGRSDTNREGLWQATGGATCDELARLVCISE